MVQTPQQADIVNLVLRELLERLIAFYDPDQIYIYGSRARGDFHEDSDYDLMVVVPDIKPDEARHNCYKLKKGLDIYADVKVYRRTSFDRQLHLKASMPSTILREGKLLYSRTGAPVPKLRYSPLPEGRTWHVCEGEPPASDPVRLENTSDWIERAREDLRGAEWFLTSDKEASLGQSLFHSQQAVEKALKAYLVWCDQPSRRHHDLNLLAADCLEIDRSLQPYLQSIEWLTEWCIAGRYPLPLPDRPRPTTELAQEGAETARRIYQTILERLPPDINDRLEQA